MKTKLMFLMITILLVPGCKKEGETKNDNPIVTNPTTITKEILPLAIGNRWIMKKSEYDSSGTTVSVHNDTITILRDTTISGEHWFIKKDPSGETACTNRSDGFWYHDSAGAHLSLKYPATPGYTYGIGSIRINDYVTAYLVTVNILSIDTLIIVPKGTFTCYRYQISVFNPLPYEHVANGYYSPGVGCVSTEFPSISPISTKISGKSELVDYTLH